MSLLWKCDNPTCGKESFPLPGPDKKPDGWSMTVVSGRVRDPQDPSLNEPLAICLMACSKPCQDAISVIAAEEGIRWSSDRGGLYQEVH